MAARALWSGHISFGMVTIPVQLFPAVEEKSIGFHMLTKNGCRLRRKLYCPETGEDVAYADTVRGYEVAPGHYVTFDKDELERLRPETGRAMDIREFVKLEEIDPLYFDRPYYVAPEEDGRKAYRLLARALNQSKMAAVAQFAMRDRGYLAVLRSRGDIIVAETLHYADEVRSADDLPSVDAAPKVDPRELKLAVQLVHSLEGKFKPDEFHDEFREQALELIRQKAAGKQIKAAPENAPPPRTKVVDLMSVLKASLAERGSRAAKRALPRGRTSHSHGRHAA